MEDGWYNGHEYYRDSKLICEYFTLYEDELPLLIGLAAINSDGSDLYIHKETGFDNDKVTYHNNDDAELKYLSIKNPVINCPIPGIDFSGVIFLIIDEYGIYTGGEIRYNGKSYRLERKDDREYDSIIDMLIEIEQPLDSSTKKMTPGEPLPGVIVPETLPRFDVRLPEVEMDLYELIMDGVFFEDLPIDHEYMIDKIIEAYDLCAEVVGKELCHYDENFTPEGFTMIDKWGS